MRERIMSILKAYSDAEVNLASEAARTLITNAIIEAVMYERLGNLTKDEKEIVERTSIPE